MSERKTKAGKSMSYLGKVHVLDADASRRAQIAFRLSEGKHPTQIYENVAELIEWSPEDGMLLLNGDTAGDSIEKIKSAINARGGGLPIAMYDVKPSTVSIVRAMLAGAIDYLEWPIDTAKLEATVTSIDARAALRLKENQKKREAQALTSQLSSREIQVLTLMVKGHGNKSVALELGISPRTVEIHRANVLGKLEAGSSADAVRIGIYAGLDE